MEGFQTEEPKQSQDWLINAIQPSGLRDRVKELMKMGENKRYKTNVRYFIEWLKDYMVSYGEFESQILGSKPATAAAAPKEEEKKKLRDKLKKVRNA